MMIARAGRQCEACGNEADHVRKRWLEAHERWEYNEETMVQALRRLILLCSDCHRATHFGLAQIRGLADSARETLQTVNGWSTKEVNEQIDYAFDLWRWRSQFHWHLDLSILETAGVTIAEPPEARARDDIARETLYPDSNSIMPANVLMQPEMVQPAKKRRKRWWRWFSKPSE